jgi:tetratricopeptide (TPR) repeat protein
MYTWCKANKLKTAIALFTVTLVTACGERTTIALRTTTETTTSNIVDAPVGIDLKEESVDGLIVGHRLMAAGEYEVALKAYTRAASELGLNADVLSALGSANLRLGRLAHAKELLQIAVKKDPEFVPAWNNLGVLLQNEGNYHEAKRVFQLAYGLDNGNSDQIKQNLTKTIAIVEKEGYKDPNENNKFELVRRGNGKYLLLSTPNSG